MGAQRTYTTLFFLLSMLLSTLLLSGCLKLDYSRASVSSPARYELTKTDLFAQTDWTGTDVAVFGVQLGDTMEEAIEKLGAPDLRTEFASTTNFEYGKGLAMPKIGLLFHFSGNKLTRITIKEPFNRFLGEKTKIGTVQKDDIYTLFGAPSKIQLMSFFTTYTYGDRNLEVFMDAKKLNGFSFVLPEAVTEFEDVAQKLKNRSIDIKDIRNEVFHETNLT